MSSVYFPELQFGGPPQKIHELSLGLIARGHEVLVATLHSKDKHLDQKRTVGNVDVQYLSWQGRGNWQVPLRLQFLKAAVRWADVVHSYGVYNLLSPLAGQAALANKRPFVLEPLGMYPPRAGSPLAKRFYNMALTSRMIRRASKIVVASDSEHEDLQNIVDLGKLVIRRNGIDPAKYRNLPSPHVFRERLGLRPQDRLVLYVGRISPIKNLDSLVCAFQRAAIPHSRLALVGPMLEPEYAANLKRLVNQSGLEGTVVFAGALYGNDVLAAYASAELFVLPSIAESFGNAAAEAVAAGIPVLLTKNCGIAPLIHQRAGLAVGGSIDELAEGLRTLLEDSSRKVLLTSRREEVVRELSIEIALDCTESLYHSLVDSHTQIQGDLQ